MKAEIERILDECITIGTEGQRTEYMEVVDIPIVEGIPEALAAILAVVAAEIAESDATLAKWLAILKVIKDELAAKEAALATMREALEPLENIELDTWIERLKQSDGEGWAIGETLERLKKALAASPTEDE